MGRVGGQTRCAHEHKEEKSEGCLISAQDKNVFPRFILQATGMIYPLFDSRKKAGDHLP
jgi:hypothetical protein